MNYFLRTYIEIDNEDLAQKEAVEFLQKLSDLGNSNLFKVQKYWKIEEYFEVSIDIQSTLKIVELSEKLADKWQELGASYIWNYENQSFFLSDKVRWASLEIIE